MVLGHQLNAPNRFVTCAFVSSRSKTILGEDCTRLQMISQRLGRCRVGNWQKPSDPVRTPQKLTNVVWLVKRCEFPYDINPLGFASSSCPRNNTAEHLAFLNADNSFGTTI